MKLEGSLARPPGVIGSATIAAHRDWIRICAWAVALGLMLAALLLRGGLLARAMGSTWPPFLTLAGVIAAGLVLDRVGVFRLLARVVIPAAASDRLATVGALCFTALLSGLVNLDIAVIVGLPVTLAVARVRQLSPARITVAAALTANATSFLLPTSNLTTLLVLDHTPHPALAYAEQSWVAWLLVTALTVGILSAFINHGGNATSRCSAVPGAAPLATLITAALALLDLVPLFAGAAAIRALLDGGITLHGGLLDQLGMASALAAGTNNLPAAAAIVVRGGLSDWTAVLGLAIGPNLLLTGSVASLISRRIARDNNAGFGAGTFSFFGATMLPFQMMLALVGLHLTGAL